jgi:Uma2 family endonuclease
MVTVITPIAKKRYALEEYFEMEEKALFKNEFFKGKITKMPGGTITHSEISGNMFMIFKMAIKSSKLNFRVYNSDQKVYIDAFDKAVYPDLTIVSDKPELYKKGKHAIVNPILLVEVLSKSTASYDRNLKFTQYQSIPTFVEYVLVEQDFPIVEVRTKKGDDWMTKIYIGLDKTLKLHSLDCEISMADIYENVEDLGDPMEEVEEKD